MNKRTFAIVTAVLTFTVGVAIARLSLPKLFSNPAPSPINKEIQLSNYRITGPYTHEGLSIFLVHGPDANNHLYTPLQEAMERKIVVVHETGDVNELAIENVSDTEEVYVQAGDIVKGGKQDRVLSVDVILPANSGRLPISAFCVESSRWSQRGSEYGDHFSISEMVANYSLKSAIKDVGTQVGVWDEVKTSQDKMVAGVASNVRSEVSPTSLPLALENEAVQTSAEHYMNNLLPIVERSHYVIGFAVAINNELKGGDVYASSAMFRRLWPRLLKAAAVEAIAEGTKTSDSPAIENVGAFLVDAEKSAETVSEVTPRTHSAKRETEKGVFFETRDMHHGGAWIHRSYLTRRQ